MRLLVICGIALATAWAPAEAQWERVRDGSLQWSPDGRPNFSAPAPRVNGRVDLSGVWLTDADPLPPGIEAIEVGLEFPRHMINIAADLESGQAPLQPAAAEIFQARLGTAAPGAYCQPTGVPHVNAIVLPYKIVQTPSLVLVLYE